MSRTDIVSTYPLAERRSRATVVEIGGVEITTGREYAPASKPSRQLPQRTAPGF